MLAQHGYLKQDGKAMSNITEHKWGDESVTHRDNYPNRLEFWCSDSYFELFPRDAISIAKHFYSQLKTKKEKNEFLDNITAVKDE